MLRIELNTVWIYVIHILTVCVSQVRMHVCFLSQTNLDVKWVYPTVETFRNPWMPSEPALVWCCGLSVCTLTKPDKPKGMEMSSGLKPPSCLNPPVRMIRRQQKSKVLPQHKIHIRPETSEYTGQICTVWKNYDTKWMCVSPTYLDILIFIINFNNSEHFK